MEPRPNCPSRLEAHARRQCVPHAPRPTPNSPRLSSYSPLDLVLRRSAPCELPAFVLCAGHSTPYAPDSACQPSPNARRGMTLPLYFYVCLRSRFPLPVQLLFLTNFLTQHFSPLPYLSEPVPLTQRSGTPLTTTTLSVVRAYTSRRLCASPRLWGRVLAPCLRAIIRELTIRDDLYPGLFSGNSLSDI